MVNIDRIKKDCFWEYNFSNEEIVNIAKRGDKRQKQFLFEKILLNSTSLFNDLKIFSKKDLKELIENYKIPSFNKNYAFKRKNIAEVYFLNKPLLVNELKWM